MFSSVFVCLSVCLPVCFSVNSFTKKTTERICIKFGVWLGYGVRKKRLNFVGDVDPDPDHHGKIIISSLPHTEATY